MVVLPNPNPAYRVRLARNLKGECLAPTVAKKPPLAEWGLFVLRVFAMQLGECIFEGLVANPS